MRRCSCILTIFLLLSLFSKRCFLHVKLRYFSSVVSYKYTLKGNACANFRIAHAYRISFGYGVSCIGYMYVNSFIRLQ